MRGHTLVELLFVLLLMGVTVSSIAPAARHHRDRALVVAAREAVVGLLAETRRAAMERGSARLQVTARARVDALAAADTLRTLELDVAYGVTVDLGGAPDVELAYDALGLGRVASQTIAFRRGREAAALVVSSYGRVRRQ